MAFVLSYYYLCSFFFLCRRILVPVLCGDQHLWVLSIVLRLCFLLFAVGCVCFWPAVSCACVGCAVCAVSAALSS